VAVQNGYELDELHDVAISSVADNNLLAYESSTSLWKNKTFSALGLLTSADASTTYAPIASPALTGNVTITSNSATAALTITQDGAGDILRLNDIAGDTSFTFVDAAGKVNTVASTTANAGLSVPHGTAPTSPVNGDIWTTTSGLLARINGSTRQYVDFDGTQTINGTKTFSAASLTLGNATAAGTIAIGSGATVSGSTRTIAIGTASAAGSTNTINIGGGSGTSTTTLNGTTNFTGPITGVVNNVSLGTGAGISVFTLFSGATVSGSTKTVTIGTGGLAGSTTTIAIGSTTGTSTTTLQGITNGVTEAVDTNNTELATTAFVVGQAGSATPIVDGTAAVGTSLRYARQDHVHPTDTSRAPLASPAFTGTPSLPTGTTAITQTVGNNTTALATTAFVTAAVPAFATFATPGVNSTTTVVSPRVVMDYIMHPGRTEWMKFGSSATSGTGASVYGGNTAGLTARQTSFFGPNVATVGYAMAIWDTSDTGLGMLGFTRGVTYEERAWNKGIWASGRGVVGINNNTWNGDANTTVRVSVGGKSSAGSGAISATESGFGWLIPGMGNALQLQVSNASAVTTVTSSFTPVARQVFDWKMFSDGTGNVTLWINDTVVATTTAGPSSATPESYNFYFEMIEQTALTATKIAYTSLNSRVWWGV
jgi:hypothetical protein